LTPLFGLAGEGPQHFEELVAGHVVGERHALKTHVVQGAGDQFGVTRGIVEGMDVLVGTVADDQRDAAPGVRGAALRGQRGQSLLRHLACHRYIDLVERRQRVGGRTVVGTCLGEVSPLLEQASPIHVSTNVVGVVTQHRVEILQRGIQIALAHKGLGAAAQGVQVIGDLGDHLVAVIDGIIEFAHVDIDRATKHPGLRRTRIDPLGLGEIGQRAVKIPVHGQDAPAIGVGEVHVRLQPERGIEIVERALQCPLSQIDRAAVVVDHGRIRALL
jgi:hypothetical protein